MKAELDVAASQDAAVHAPIIEKVLPDHGRMKEVRATATRFKLMAQVA